MNLLSGNRSGAALRVLSLFLGLFVFFMGFDKVDWLTTPSNLTDLLYEWQSSAPASSRWYLDTVAIPGAPVFARIIPVAEMTAGLALILGLYVRVAAAATFLMVLNFHFASDVLLHTDYLINAYGLPVLGGLLALALGGSRLPLSVGR